MIDIKLKIQYIQSIINTIIDDVRYWYWNWWVFDVIYNVKYGVKNLWDYKSIIWNDRWYDHSFILNLLVFKMKRNIKQWNNAHYIGSDFTKKRMIVLTKRLQEYEDNKEQLLSDCISKKYNKKQYNIKLKQLQHKTWTSFGRQMYKFWD